ncbi:MAG: hypothetical protein EZS28_026926, partial [Streblomastix strix]
PPVQLKKLFQEVQPTPKKGAATPKKSAPKATSTPAKPDPKKPSDDKQKAQQQQIEEEYDDDDLGGEVINTKSGEQGPIVDDGEDPFASADAEYDKEVGIEMDLSDLVMTQKLEQKDG